MADPNAYYVISGEKIVKGRQFPEGILPINAQETLPSLDKKIQIELQLLQAQLKRLIKGPSFLTRLTLLFFLLSG